MLCDDRRAKAVGPCRPKASRCVGPKVSHLLLACAANLFDIVEHLLDRRPIGKRLQNLPHADVWIDGEEELGAGLFLDDYHADHPVGGTIGCQERLVFLHDGLAVLDALDGLPSSWLSRAWPDSSAVCHTWVVGPAHAVCPSSLSAAGCTRRQLCPAPR